MFEKNAIEDLPARILKLRAARKTIRVGDGVDVFAVPITFLRKYENLRGVSFGSGSQSKKESSQGNRHRGPGTVNCSRTLINNL